MAILQEHLATILVSLAVLGMLAAAVVYMVRSKKKNPTGCSCGCGSCPYSEGCAGTKATDTE